MNHRTIRDCSDGEGIAKAKVTIGGGGGERLR